MNIERLTGTLTVSDSPGLATVDPRFTDIATLVQDGKYDEAAAQAEAVLAEEVYDIRIIGYFAYGFFLEKGVGGFKELFPALAELLRENIEAVGPVRNRPKHVKTIFTWFFRQLAKKLQYEEDRQTPMWSQWENGVSSEEVAEIINAADTLRRALTMVLEDSAGPVLDSLSKVGDWLRRFEGIVYREPEPEPEPVAQVEEQAPEESAAAAPQPGAPAMAVSGVEATSVQMQGSSALGMLMRRIDAFSNLLKEGKMAQAALVAGDINEVIKNFDPRVYFPELFSGFTLSYVTHINQMTAFEGHKASVEWKAMQELYKVDLDSFTSFDACGIDFTLDTPETPAAEAPVQNDYGFGNEFQPSYGDTGTGETGMNNGGW